MVGVSGIGFRAIHMRSQDGRVLSLLRRFFLCELLEAGMCEKEFVT